jgi:hypothetical protein
MNSSTEGFTGNAETDDEDDMSQEESQEQAKGKGVEDDIKECKALVDALADRKSKNGLRKDGKPPPWQGRGKAMQNGGKKGEKAEKGGKGAANWKGREAANGKGKGKAKGKGGKGSGKGDKGGGKSGARKGR